MKLRVRNKDASVIYENMKKISEKLKHTALLDVDDLYMKLQTRAGGLSDAEVLERYQAYGKNEVAHEKAPKWYVQFAKSFANPFVLVLIVLAFISIFTDVICTEPGEQSWIGIVIIITMVAISGLLSFIQEYRSNMAAEKLKAMIHTTTTVMREGKILEIPLELIVPGDIIKLAAGDMIPADIRIISCKDLFISQSALTGESLPVEKLDTLSQKTIDIAQLENIALLGTTVISGTAIGVVIATGDNTYFGAMAKTLVGERVETSFDRGVNSVSFLLIRFMLVMVPIVFFINGFTKGDWFGAFLFATSVAVGLTPEMLPMIVNANLAKGAYEMAKRKTVVKSLSSIQNFGAMDVLCTDKTGTLTEDKIIVERYLDIHGNEDRRVLRHAYLNSHYQTGLKNLMDLAILSHGDEIGFVDLERRYWKVDEIPFDFNRRRMSVVLESLDGKRQIITKGAVEEMLSICQYAEYKGKIVSITKEIKAEILNTTQELNKEGMRVIAVAQKNHTEGITSFTVEDESNMVLMGYIGFLDPPKASTAGAIRKLHDHGVEVKVLTGDNEYVTMNICKQVGLEVGTVVLGHEIETMNEGKLKDIVETTNIFAKLSPLQKTKIVKALQSNGHIVGFMGDGINDASALRESDVGISVDSGVDIAKESADIILLEKSLNVLEDGVIEGRKTFGNIIKYIKMTASSNFGNVFSVLVASAFLPFLPMLPLQLLMQNLFYDISQVAIPWDTMDDEYLRVPQKWDAKDIGRFMIYIGPISSIFDIIMYVIMWYVFKANTVESQALFQSGWFIEGLLSQTLIVHMIRTKRIPFVQSIASKSLLYLTIIIMGLGISIPFTTFGAAIGLVPLPPSYFIWLIGVLLGYCILTQGIKKIYIRKFNSWL